jgi:hypothetical protein
LQAILGIAPEFVEDKRTVPLSNVKRLFRSKFNTELSETVLGHSKLSELLQDPRMKDICRVRLGAHGYVVVQVCPSNNSPQDKCDVMESMSIQCDRTESTASIGSELDRRSETSLGSSPCDPLNIELDEFHVGTPLECLDLQAGFDDDFGWSMLMSPDLFDQDEAPRRLQFCLNEPLEGIEEVGSSSQAATFVHSSQCSMLSPSSKLDQGRI